MSECIPETWKELHDLQGRIAQWQSQYFPAAEEWELVLGVCEEAGELAQCVLKMKRGIHPERYNAERVKDSIGDVIVFLIGICIQRGWNIAEVLSDTVKEVLERQFDQRRIPGLTISDTKPSLKVGDQ
jgi:NTP pyrophosphatase (non-canonical NTP hydrolase)